MAKSFPNTGVSIIDASADLPGSPVEGLMVFQKDTNELKIYDGSAWRSMLDTDTPPGLSFITSTTFNSSSFNVDNVFSSTFYNYYIQMNITNTTGPGYFNIRFRVGSTTDSANNYRSVPLWAVSNAASQGHDYINSGSGTRVGFVNGSLGAFADIFVFNPNITAYTYLHGDSFDDRTSLGVSSRNYGVQTTTVQNTGFNIYSETGATLTGNISVYGYRNS